MSEEAGKLIEKTDSSVLARGKSALLERRKINQDLRIQAPNPSEFSNQEITSEAPHPEKKASAHIVTLDRYTPDPLLSLQMGLPELHGNKKYYMKRRESRIIEPTEIPKSKTYEERDLDTLEEWMLTDYRVFRYGIEDV